MNKTLKIWNKLASMMPHLGLFVLIVLAIHLGVSKSKKAYGEYQTKLASQQYAQASICLEQADKEVWKSPGHTQYGSSTLHLSEDNPSGIIQVNAANKLQVLLTKEKTVIINNTVEIPLKSGIVYEGNLILHCPDLFELGGSTVRMYKKMTEDQKIERAYEVCKKSPEGWKRVEGGTWVNSENSEKDLVIGSKIWTVTWISETQIQLGGQMFTHGDKTSFEQQKIAICYGYETMNVLIYQRK